MNRNNRKVKAHTRKSDGELIWGEKSESVKLTIGCSLKGRRTKYGKTKTKTRGTETIVFNPN